MITLRELRKHSPCINGWKNALKYFDKDTEDEELSLSVLMNTVGIKDTLWCMSVIGGYEKKLLMFAINCARSMQHLMLDDRSITALDMAEQYAKGDIDVTALDKAKIIAKAALLSTPISSTANENWIAAVIAMKAVSGEVSPHIPAEVQVKELWKLI